MYKYLILLCLLVCADCAAPEPTARPLNGLTFQVKVVPSEWIQEQVVIRSGHTLSGAEAFFDRQECTIYIPANISNSEFQKLMVHEGRHALGEDHWDTDDTKWIVRNPQIDAAIQSRCVHAQG